MRILLVEDERTIANFVARGLTEEGHRVEIAETLTSARAAAGEGWDLLIVDRMLPDGDGLSLVRELRRAGSEVPALCLTAMDRVEERVAGLTGGADDYLIKPFSFAELLARVQTVTRRATRATQEIVVGDLHIDVAAHRVDQRVPQHGLVLIGTVFNRCAVVHRRHPRDVLRALQVAAQPVQVLSDAAQHRLTRPLDGAGPTCPCCRPPVRSSRCTTPAGTPRASARRAAPTRMTR